MDRGGISRRQLLANAGRYGGAAAAGGSLATFLAACGADSQSGGTSDSGSDSVTVGHLFSRTGATAAVGQASAAGFKLRIDAANSAGGVKSLDGAQIKVVEGDDQTKPEVAGGEIARLAERGIQLTVASVSSPAMLQATQEAERQQLPIVNAIGVFDKITDRGFKYTFSSPGTAQSYTRDFVTNTKEVLDQKQIEPRRVGLLFEADIQGPFYAEWMRKFVPELTDWDVVYLDYPLDTTDFGPLISRLKAQDVDVVALASYAKDGALILEAMKSQRYDVELLTGCMGGVISREFVETAGATAAGFMGESYWVEDAKVPGQSEFLKAAEGKSDGGVDVFFALGYAAGAVVVDALERAASTDRKKIRDAIAATSLEPGEAGYILPGGVKFNEAGANTAVRGVYYQIEDGEQRAVLPSEFAVTEPRVPHDTW